MKKMNNYSDVINFGAELIENFTINARKKANDFIMKRKVKKVKEGLEKSDELLSKMNDMEED